MGSGTCRNTSAERFSTLSGKGGGRMREGEGTKGERKGRRKRNLEVG